MNPWFIVVLAIVVGVTAGREKRRQVLLGFALFMFALAPGMLTGAALLFVWLFRSPRRVES